MSFALGISMFTAGSLLQSLQTITRNGAAAELPVYAATSPANREADHATVAINSENDQLVVFHTDLGPDEKQVEAVYWRYGGPGATEQWSTVWTTAQMSDTVLRVGDRNPNPLNRPVGDLRKCERPAVVSVGPYFCVVWSRTYTVAGGANDEAVVECAWIKWDTSAGPTGQGGAPVVLGLTASGAGFPLLPLSGGIQTAIKVEECKGVADVMSLGFHATRNEYRVLVAYVHQTAFGGFQFGQGTGDRNFDLNFVECAINASTQAVTRVPVTGSITPVRFDGWNQVTSGVYKLDTGGLILPELTKGNQDLLFVTYEEQFGSPDPNNTSDPYDGRIRLVALSRTENAQGEATLSLAASASYLSPALLRRRPQFGSKPGNSVTLAFNQANDPNDDTDLVVAEWSYVNGSLVPRVYLDAPFAFLTGSADDKRPVTAHGINNPDFRRCYFERVDPAATDQCKILAFNPLAPESSTNPLVLESSPLSLPLGRPAVDYLHNSGTSAGLPHYVPLSFQKTNPTLGKQRVFFRALGY